MKTSPKDIPIITKSSKASQKTLISKSTPSQTDVALKSTPKRRTPSPNSAQSATTSNKAKRQSSAKTNRKRASPNKNTNTSNTRKTNPNAKTTSSIDIPAATIETNTTTATETTNINENESKKSGNVMTEDSIEKKELGDSYLQFSQHDIDTWEPEERYSKFLTFYCLNTKLSDKQSEDIARKLDTYLPQLTSWKNRQLEREKLQRKENGEDRFMDSICMVHEKSLDNVCKELGYPTLMYNFSKENAIYDVLITGEESQMSVNRLILVDNKYVSIVLKSVSAAQMRIQIIGTLDDDISENILETQQQIDEQTEQHNLAKQKMNDFEQMSDDEWKEIAISMQKKAKTGKKSKGKGKNKNKDKEIENVEPSAEEIEAVKNKEWNKLKKNLATETNTLNRLKKQKTTDVNKEISKNFPFINWTPLRSNKNNELSDICENLNSKIMSKISIIPLKIFYHIKGDTSDCVVSGDGSTILAAPSVGEESELEAESDAETDDAAAIESDAEGLSDVEESDVDDGDDDVSASDIDENESDIDETDEDIDDAGDDVIDVDEVENGGKKNSGIRYCVTMPSQKISSSRNNAMIKDIEERMKEDGINFVNDYYLNRLGAICKVFETGVPEIDLLSPLRRHGINIIIIPKKKSNMTTVTNILNGNGNNVWSSPTNRNTKNEKLTRLFEKIANKFVSRSEHTSINKDLDYKRYHEQTINQRQVYFCDIFNDEQEPIRLRNSIINGDTNNSSIDVSQISSEDEDDDFALASLIDSSRLASVQNDSIFDFSDDSDNDDDSVGNVGNVDNDEEEADTEAAIVEEDYPIKEDCCVTVIAGDKDDNCWYKLQCAQTASALAYNDYMNLDGEDENPVSDSLVLYPNGNQFNFAINDLHRQIGALNKMKYEMDGINSGVTHKPYDMWATGSGRSVKKQRDPIAAQDFYLQWGIHPTPNGGPTYIIGIEMNEDQINGIKSQPAAYFPWADSVAVYNDELELDISKSTSNVLSYYDLGLSGLNEKEIQVYNAIRRIYSDVKLLNRINSKLIMNDEIQERHQQLFELYQQCQDYFDKYNSGNFDWFMDEMYNVFKNQIDCDGNLLLSTDYLHADPNDTKYRQWLKISSQMGYLHKNVDLDKVTQSQQNNDNHNLNHNQMNNSDEISEDNYDITSMFADLKDTAMLKEFTQFYSEHVDTDKEYSSKDALLAPTVHITRKKNHEGMLKGQNLNVMVRLFTDSTLQNAMDIGTHVALFINDEQVKVPKEYSKSQQRMLEMEKFRDEKKKEQKNDEGENENISDSQSGNESENATDGKSDTNSIDSEDSANLMTKENGDNGDDDDSVGVCGESEYGLKVVRIYRGSQKYRYDYLNIGGVCTKDISDIKIYVFGMESAQASTQPFFAYNRSGPDKLPALAKATSTKVSVKKETNEQMMREIQTNQDSKKSILYDGLIRKPFVVPDVNQEQRFVDINDEYLLNYH